MNEDPKEHHRGDRQNEIDVPEVHVKNIGRNEKLLGHIKKYRKYCQHIDCCSGRNAANKQSGDPEKPVTRADDISRASQNGHDDEEAKGHHRNHKNNWCYPDSSHRAAFSSSRLPAQDASRPEQHLE